MRYTKFYALLILNVSMVCSFGEAEEDEPLIVIANRFAQEEKEVSASVSVFSEKDIERIQPQTFDDLFRGEPGVEFDGGPRVAGEQLQIRGQDGDSVTVRIDGARQNFVSGHSGQRFFTDPMFLNSAEIVRGAKSHLYGSGAAGVINLSTYDPEDLINPDFGFGGRIQTGYQGVNEEVAASALFAAGTDQVGILLGYANRQADNIRLGGGEELSNSAIDRESGLLKLTYKPVEALDFTLGYNFYESQDTGGANPQGDVDTSNALVDRELRFQQLSLGANYRPEDNDLIDLSAKIYYNETTQTRDYQALTGSNVDRQNEHVIETLGIDLVNRSRFEAFGGENTLLIGFEAFEDQQVGSETRDAFFSGAAPGTSSGRPNADRQSLGVYLENRTQWDNGLSLTAGIRYDQYETSGRYLQNDDSQVSPHLALRYEITEGVSIFADYARAFTAPTLNQIYQDGSHFGVVPNDPFVTVTPSPFGPPSVSFNYFEEVFVSNENLSAEVSDNFELGLDFTKDIFGGAFDAKLVAFQQNGQDTFDPELVGTPFIRPVFIGFAGPGELTQVFRQSVNREETTIRGFEADLNYVHDLWYGRLTYSAIDGEDDSNGNNLNTIPAHKLFLEAGVTVFENFSFGANALFVADRDNRVDDETLKTSAFQLYGLFAQWQPRESFTLTFGVNNLFDQEHERNNINNPEPGRNAYISASYQF